MTEERRFLTSQTWTFGLVHVPVYGRICRELSHQLGYWNNDKNLSFMFAVNSKKL